MYDAAGRRTSATDAAGQKTSYNYDAVGNVVSMQHPDGQVYSFEYDADSRRIKTIYPDGTFELLTYDFASRTTSKTDQAGRITRFNYDACGRLQSVVDALGQLTSYTYDTLGNRISQSDPNGHVTRWEYDAFRRVTKRTLPLGMFETFVYDPAGNLTRKTDFNGKTTSYTYDADDRLLSKTYPDFSSVEFTYRPGGQRATMIDSRGVTSYLYDAIDRVTQVIQPDGTAISYTYDAADNRTSITVPSGMTRFAYDAVDRLTNVTEPNGAVTSYSYDTVGNLVHMSFPNNTQSDHTYDSLNRLIAVENKRADNTLLSGFTYSLGPAGNRLQANEQGGRTVSYAYDALYRLTGETFTDPARGNRAISYTYDAAGNRLVKNDSATGVTTYVYDTNDRLLSENGRSYSYDANGNLLAQPDGTTYQYDAENRLIQAQTPAGSVQYAYDADGVRVQSLAAGAATNYLVDKNRRYAQVLEERNGAGALLASNIFGYGLIRRQQGAAGAYYLYDGQRSVRQLTDLNGAVTDIYTYEGFGSLLDHTGIASNPYQFGGEEFDAHLGQYYLRARYYQPALGRFLTVDPAAAIPAEPRTLNRYVYAWNDPINQQDPSGEQTSLAEAMISVAINGILAQLPEQGIAVEIPELHIDFSEVEGWQDTNQPQRYPNTSDILHTAFETVRGDFSRYNVKVLRWGETAKQAGLVKPKLKDKLVSVQPWDGDNCHEPIAVAWGCAPLNSDKGWAFLQTMMNNVPLSALPKKARGNPNGAAGILLGHTISHEAGHLYGICHPGPPACVSPFTANSGIMWSPSLQNRLTAGWDAPSQKGLEKALGLKP
jgi:RHS repeat-associated protein